MERDLKINEDVLIYCERHEESLILDKFKVSDKLATIDNNSDERNIYLEIYQQLDDELHQVFQNVRDAIMLMTKFKKYKNICYIMLFKKICL